MTSKSSKHLSRTERAERARRRARKAKKRDKEASYVGLENECQRLKHHNDDLQQQLDAFKNRPRHKTWLRRVVLFFGTSFLWFFLWYLIIDGDAREYVVSAKQMLVEQTYSTATKTVSWMSENIAKIMHWFV